MLNFASFITTVAPFLRDVFSTPTFQTAAESAINGVINKLASHAGDPAALQQVANEMKSFVPQIVGSIVKGTPAEKLVNAANIPASTSANIPAPPGDRT